MTLYLIAIVMVAVHVTFIIYLQYVNRYVHELVLILEWSNINMQVESQ